MPEASSEQRDLLTQYFKDAPVMMQVTDMEGSIKAATNFWAEKLGYSVDEMVGRHELDFQTDGSREHVEAVLKSALASGRTVNEAVHYVHKDGHVVEVLWSSVVERNEDGLPLHTVSVFVDTPEAVPSHTLQTQQQRTEALSGLLSGVAHDFNNILTVVQGNLEMTLEETDDALVTLFMNDAIKAIDRGAKLTSQLLSFANPANLNPTALDINDALRSAESVLRRLTPERIALEMVCASDLWLTVLDNAQLQKVLLALVGNASDAMPRGGHLKFETANTTLDAVFAQQLALDLEPGPYVMLTVTDSSDQSGGATALHSAESELDGQAMSTEAGRNLSMVQSFVERSNGTVLVSGQPDRGRSISLLFPAIPEAGQSAAPADVQAAPQATPDTAPTTPAQKDPTEARVLVVEDEVEVRRVLVRQLSRNGITVAEAGDGDEAYDMLVRGYRPAVMVTDVVMPGLLQGPDLVEKAREIVPNLQVIYVSGYLTDAGLSGQMGPNDVQLMKPVGRETFVSTIQRVLAETTGG